MSKDRGKKTPPASGKKPAPPPRRQPTEVQPISPLALAGAIGAALIIAAILLYVINTRLNASPAAAPTATPVVAPRPTSAGVVPTIAVNPPAAQPTTPAAAVTGGFSKGNAQAKVTFTEFADFK